MRFTINVVLFGDLPFNNKYFILLDTLEPPELFINSTKYDGKKITVKLNRDNGIWENIELAPHRTVAVIDLPAFADKLDIEKF